jgi:hypothetical protein
VTLRRGECRCGERVFGEIEMLASELVTVHAGGLVTATGYTAANREFRGGRARPELRPAPVR